MIRTSISTGPRWLLAVTMLAAALVAGPTAPTSAHGDLRNEGISVVAQTNPPPCRTVKRCWVDKRVRQFRNGRLGNARGLEFPRYMKRRITRAVRDLQGSMRVSARGDDDWWRGPLSGAKCFAVSIVAKPYACERAGEEMSEFVAETNRVIAFCGGKAVIGFFGGGGSGRSGYWGAGAGLADCFWGGLFEVF